jgi:hypothetical protein
MSIRRLTGLEASMYELIRRLTIRQLTLEQLPLLVIALSIAELFYKFHSFLLETGAFLLTWLVLGALHAATWKIFGRSDEAKLR